MKNFSLTLVTMMFLLVFPATAAEKAQQTVQECEEFSEAEQNHAQKMVKELDLTETEVCNVMDSLVVKT